MTPLLSRAALLRFLRVAGAILMIVGGVIQLIHPVHRYSELPSDGHMNELVQVPGDVDSLLRRSCYDCHSDETRWPWYARVAPTSWLITGDVKHGRSNLDFSRWSTNAVREPTPDQRLQWMCREVRRGIMPPRLYRLAHPSARVTGVEQDVLCKWAEEQLAHIRAERALSGGR